MNQTTLINGEVNTVTNHNDVLEACLIEENKIEE